MLPASVRQELAESSPGTFHVFFLGALGIGLTTKQGARTYRSLFKDGREGIVWNMLRLYWSLLWRLPDLRGRFYSPLQPLFKLSDILGMFPLPVQLET